MLRFVQDLVKSFSEAVLEPVDMSTQFYPVDRYAPSPQDVVEVKQELLSRIHLPLELIDTIIDYAEYWPKTVTERGDVIITSGRNENRFLLRSFPIGYAPKDGSYQFQQDSSNALPMAQPRPWPKDREVPKTSTADVLGAWTSTGPPRTKHPVRKIVFTIKSHDQGWGGEHFENRDYEGSYTWFDVGREELCAFPEDSVSEQSKNAPWPQLLLNRQSVREVTLGNGKKVQLPDNSSLVCSLRTVVPETILAPASPTTENDGFDFDDQGGHNDNDSSQTGGLVGPPDALNPGSQAPLRPPPTEFTQPIQPGGLVGPPDDLNPGSQAPYRARPAHGFRGGRCGVGMAPPNLDWTVGSSVQQHNMPNNFTLPEQSTSGGLVGPPDELNPGSQEPLHPPRNRQGPEQRQKYKFDHVFMPDDNSLQKNRRAKRDGKTHVITWSSDDKVDPKTAEGDMLEAVGRGRSTGSGEFVKSLKVGDCVTVWGKSRFGGWANYVEKVKMEVYWRV